MKRWNNNNNNGSLCCWSVIHNYEYTSMVLSLWFYGPVPCFRRVQSWRHVLPPRPTRWPEARPTGYGDEEGGWRRRNPRPRTGEGYRRDGVLRRFCFESWVAWRSDQMWVIYRYLPGVLLNDDRRRPPFPAPVLLGCFYSKTCGIWSGIWVQPVFTTVIRIFREKLWSWLISLCRTKAASLFWNCGIGLVDRGLEWTDWKSDTRHFGHTQVFFITELGWFSWF